LIVIKGEKKTSECRSVEGSEQMVSGLRSLAPDRSSPDASADEAAPDREAQEHKLVAYPWPWTSSAALAGRRPWETLARAVEESRFASRRRVRRPAVRYPSAFQHRNRAGCEHCRIANRDGHGKTVRGLQSWRVRSGVECASIFRKTSPRVLSSAASDQQQRLRRPVGDALPWKQPLAIELDAGGVKGKSTWALIA